MRTTSITRRVAAGLTGVALAAAGLLGVALPASATEDPAANPPTGNIDFKTLGSITVHKLTQPDTPGTQPGTGAETTVPTGSLPIQGVEFTVEKVNLDLSNPANWEGLSSLTVAQAKEKGTSPAGTGTTAADGTYKFSGLGVGLYIVTESNVAGATVDGKPVSIAGAGQPFLVSIPSAVKGQWLYDVHAYPKNSTTAIEKTVTEPTNPGLGSTVSWNVSATAPKLNSADKLTSFGISDTLDGRLTYTGVSGVTYNGVALADGDYQVDVAGQSVKVTLLAPGLAKVTATSGKALAVTISTTVNSLGENGIIPNTATVFTNVNGTEHSTDSNQPVTKWGAVKIVKQDKDNKSALQGAEFQVFASEADAVAGTNPITAGGASSFTTGADGSVTVPGLLVGQGDSRDYWIKETKAPAGYVLNATPIKVTVVPSGTATAVSVAVDNTKQDHPALPVTGGMGTLAFGVIGAALVAIAGGVALRSRRKGAGLK